MRPIGLTPDNLYILSSRNKYLCHTCLKDRKAKHRQKAKQ